MTGPDHFRAAEDLLGQARGLDDPAAVLAAAQVHATLALTAATILRELPSSRRFDNWRDLLVSDGEEASPDFDEADAARVAYGPVTLPAVPLAARLAANDTTVLDQLNDITEEARRG